MAQELLYTSAPRGLKPGSRGFCTVEATAGLPPTLVTALEGLSGYRHVAPPGDPANPVVRSHVTLSLGGRTYSVLSRIADAGADYTGRTNKLAHHVVLDPSERPKGGPAWLVAQPGLLRDRFEGEPKTLPPRLVPAGDRPAAVCTAWQSAAGDAGWAGVLAEAFLADPSRPAYLVVPAGLDVRPLFEEAIALLPPDRRWGATFTTLYTSLPQTVNCLWRTVPAGSKEAHESRRFVQALRLDLTEPLSPAAGGPLVEAARTGRVPVASPAALRSAAAALVPAAGPTPAADDDVTLDLMLVYTSRRPDRFLKEPLTGPPKLARRSKLRAALWAVAAVACLVVIAAPAVLAVTHFSNEAAAVAKAKNELIAANDPEATDVDTSGGMPDVPLKPEGPKPEGPKPEGPKPEEPKPEEPKPEEPKPEEPKPEEPKPEEPKPEEPKPEEPKPEEPKPEGPKPEGPHFGQLHLVRSDDSYILSTDEITFQEGENLHLESWVTDSFTGDGYLPPRPGSSVIFERVDAIGKPLRAGLIELDKGTGLTPQLFLRFPKARREELLARLQWSVLVVRRNGDPATASNHRFLFINRSLQPKDLQLADGLLSWPIGGIENASLPPALSTALNLNIDGVIYRFSAKEGDASARSKEFTTKLCSLLEIRKEELTDGEPAIRLTLTPEGLTVKARMIDLLSCVEGPINLRGQRVKNLFHNHNLPLDRFVAGRASLETQLHFDALIGENSTAIFAKIKELIDKRVEELLENNDNDRIAEMETVRKSAQSLESVIDLARGLSNAVVHSASVSFDVLRPDGQYESIELVRFGEPLTK